MAKKTEVFNPVKEDTAGVQARRAIWSSRSLDMALEGIKQGRKLIANPFYENNTKLLKVTGKGIMCDCDDKEFVYIRGTIKNTSKAATGDL